MDRGDYGTVVTVHVVLMPLVVSVRVTGVVNTMLMGGEQSGLNTMSVDKEMSALPLLTVKLPDAENVCLFPALGLFPPEFWHCAVTV